MGLGNSGIAKRLKEKDNAITTPGRVTQPVGTVFKEKIEREESGGKTVVVGNPSTAPAGSLSGGNGNAPRQSQPSFNPRMGQAGDNANLNAAIAKYTNYATNIGNWLMGGSWDTPTPFPTLSTPGKVQSAIYRGGVPNNAGTVNSPVSGAWGNYNAKNAPKPSWQGTAGMYTYGQFSDPIEAFATLLDRGVPTNIPSYIADAMGVTEMLSQNDSGWTLQDGNWVNTGGGTGGGGGGGTGGGGTSGGGGGGTGGVGGEEPPKWVRDRYGRVIRNKYNLSNYVYGDVGSGRMKGTIKEDRGEGGGDFSSG